MISNEQPAEKHLFSRPGARLLRQPMLSEAVICVQAPQFAVSGRDGQLRGDGADGFYDRDRRLLHTLLLLINDLEPESAVPSSSGPDRVSFTAVHRDTGDDMNVHIDRERTATGVERITVRNLGRDARRLRIQVLAGTDLADVAEVKRGADAEPLPASVFRHTDGTRGLRWVDLQNEVRTRVTARGSTAHLPHHATGGRRYGTFTWDVTLQPGKGWRADLTVTGTFHLPDTLSPQPAFPVRPGAAAPWVVPTVDGDHRLAGLVRHGLAELDALRLADPLSPDGGPEDQFIAAGCPWYLTLFGRDSIWAARMMLPLGTELARGTLRALARRQGEAKDDFREEAPGRILHELRPAESLHNNGMVLPAVYYGSMDATPLFVVLLVEAWRWGLPEAEVRALLPHAEAAMRWLRDHGDPDHDGLLEYQSPREDALTHQGWKDSEESVLDADGGRASPPIALCEVQGYAYQAAVGFADLLDHLGREEDAKGWRGWAATLRERFHNAFWLPSTGPADPAPRYVAIALGRDKSPVTGPASNMGHLLGTGILNAEESRDVAAWLAAPGLNSGWGLRSRSSAVTGFNPLSYHGGAVWSHDTAIAVSGLAAEGHRDEATRLLSGLLDAASRFGYRMPELYSGADRTRSSAEPLPYPPACRPQGWAAAAGVCLLASRLGLRPDAARRVLEVRPTPVDLPGRLQVSGLWLGGLPFDVSVDPGAHAEVTGSALQGWRVVRLP